MANIFIEFRFSMVYVIIQVQRLPKFIFKLLFFCVVLIIIITKWFDSSKIGRFNPTESVFY